MRRVPIFRSRPSRHGNRCCPAAVQLPSASLPPILNSAGRSCAIGIPDVLAVSAPKLLLDLEAAGRTQAFWMMVPTAFPPRLVWFCLIKTDIVTGQQVCCCPLIIPTRCNCHLSRYPPMTPAFPGRVHLCWLGGEEEAAISFVSCSLWTPPPPPPPSKKCTFSLI